MSAANLVQLVTAVVTLTAVLANIRQLRDVHRAVNSTQERTVARVEQLTAALTDQGANVPKTPGRTTDP